ncbi:MAG: MarR family transcriptional regulator [Chloroflexi bacterium]|nr:MarR family transcriptional regulator [Chloroflexota bacterium]
MSSHQEQLKHRAAVSMGRVLISLQPWAALVRLLTELTVPELRALLVLHSAGPLRMGDVAARLGIGLPVATSLVTRLEGKGLVARQHSREDRRVVLCSVTESGGREAERFWGGFHQRVNELMGPLAGDELESLVHSMELLTSAGH